MAHSIGVGSQEETMEVVARNSVAVAVGDRELAAAAAAVAVAAAEGQDTRLLRLACQRIA